MLVKSLCFVLLWSVCEGAPHLDAEAWFPFEDLTTVSPDGYAIFGTRDRGYFGEGGINLGDINGDGLDDLAIGDYYYNDTGRVVVVFGSNSTERTSMTVETAVAAPNGFYIYNNISEANMGHSFGIGDYNNDGKTDLLLGSLTSTTIGYLVIVWGRLDDTWSDMVITPDIDPEIAVIFYGNLAKDYFGFSFANLGDFNNDSYPDFVVSASSTHYGSQQYTGRTYIVFGGETPPTGGTLNETNSLHLVGTRERETLGYGLDTAGDFNGDGIPDMVISSFLLYTNGLERNGRVYVMFGSESHSIGEFIMEDFEVSDSTGFYIDGEIDQRNLGSNVAGGCDINNDGFDDVIIGGRTNGVVGQTGIVVVLFGRASGFKALNFSDVTPEDGFFITTGDSGADNLGLVVGCLGNLNGDEYDDYYIVHTDKNGDSAVTVLYGSDASANITLVEVEPLTHEISNTREAFYAGNHLGEGNTSLAMVSFYPREYKGAAYIFENFPPLILTDSPTLQPTVSPTLAPTMSPTTSPTTAPTMSPTTSPSLSPTTSPTTGAPSTLSPSASPTTSPTTGPTTSPTSSPTVVPSDSPTSSPSASPSTSPTLAPTNAPTLPYCDISISTTGGAGLTWDVTDNEEDEEIANGEFGGDVVDFTLLASEEYLLFLSSDTVPAGTSITITINGQDTVISLEVELTTSTEIAGVTCEAISNKIAALDSGYSTTTTALLALLMVLV